MRVWWSPRLLGAHLLALVCVSAAVGLGVWQLHAWHVHREAAQRDLTGAAPVPIDDLIGPDDPFPGDQVGRPVTIRGSWVGAGTVLVSDRTDTSGDRGLWVVTPLTNGGTDAAAVPVVRGWVPAGTDAAAVPPATGDAEVVGWLQPADSGGAADADPSDDVLPALRTADLVQRVHQDLYDGYVVAEQPTSGLQPAMLDRLPDTGTFTALRNFLYALEWWVFGGFALFLWWRHVTEVTAEEAAIEAAARSSQEDDVASAP
ncbi:SURF1 family protein [Nocardioides panacisoli]|uniref:SURF1 family protein n=1 Tax=Nocardioides panacisoli TaxID=627624 RepID=UPI0031D3F0E1